MDLGCALIRELWPDGSTERLGVWMAHNVAELIDQAEKARGKAKAAAQDRCRAAILELWAYRHSLEGRRPTAQLEPIIDTLERLKPEVSNAYYQGLVWDARPEDADAQETSETRKWLTLAREADSAARELVGWALGEAAAAATDKSLEWIKLARKAGAGDDGLVRITLLLRELRPEFAHDKLKAIDPIKSRLAKLKSLRKAMSELGKELQTALETAQANKASNC